MKQVKFTEKRISLKNSFINFFLFDEDLDGYSFSTIKQEIYDFFCELRLLTLFEIQFSTIIDLLDKNYEVFVKIPKDYQNGKLYLIENSPWLNSIQISEEHKEEILEHLKTISYSEKDKVNINDIKHYYIGSPKEHFHFLAFNIEHLNKKPDYEKMACKGSFEDRCEHTYLPFIQNPEKYQINEMYSWDFPENTKNLYKFYIDRTKKYVNLEPHIDYVGLHNSNRDIYFSEKNMLISAHLGSRELMGNSFHDVGHTFIFDNPVFFNRTAKYAYDKDFPEYYWEGLIYEYPNSPLLKYFKGKNYRHFIMPLSTFSYRDIVATDYKIVTGVKTI